MKTLKIMSIIGIVFAIFCLGCIFTWSNSYDYEAGLGWGMFGMLYLIAYAIVGLVQSVKNKDK